MKWIADEALATTPWLAGELPRPLLLEGAAGVGKTALIDRADEAFEAYLQGRHRHIRGPGAFCPRHRPRAAPAGRSRGMNHA